LAGVFFDAPPLDGFNGEWIVPGDGYSGHHMYVANGFVAFDCHGYSRREDLLTHCWKGWRKRHPGWNASFQAIDFPLRDTVASNRRKHLGPDQHFGDPVVRARRFLAAFQIPCST